jgi:hypothetical protein
MRLVLALFVALLAPAVASAQAPDPTPDHRGEAVHTAPTYRGERANAPIPPHYHIRNEGGSDGNGLCVVCALIINGAYQGVPDLDRLKESRLWRAAKAAPGGYSPDKLAALVRRVMPDEKYASFTGTGGPEDRALLEKISKAGYPIGATMNTGALYGYRPIHHMVSLIHYRRNGVAMVVDNNRPGLYSIMPSAEWERRWPDMGQAWAWFWTRLPRSVQEHGPELGYAVLIVAGAVCALAVKRRLDDDDDEEEEQETCFVC